MGIALIAIFLALFVLGFPVVYAILIPAIGAVLGYRQARAAQSLRESLRANF